MQLTEVACFLATACKGEEKKFDSRTCAESWNPPLKWRNYCLWSKKAMFVLYMIHNKYFTCTLLNSDKNSARAKVAGNGKSPEGEGEGGFLGQTIGMGRYWWILPIYWNNHICKYFFTFCPSCIDQWTYFILLKNYNFVVWYPGIPFLNIPYPINFSPQNPVSL